MTETPYLFFVPTLSGGDGRDGVRDFYRGLMGQLPQDFQLTPVSRTLGSDRRVREVILRFTHSVAMNWLVPGIAPTGKRVAIPLIIIFTFQGDKVESERLYWEQASMLMQLGLLEPGGLPITGTQSVQRLQQLTKAGDCSGIGSQPRAYVSDFRLKPCGRPHGGSANFAAPLRVRVWRKRERAAVRNNAGKGREQ
jgi:carboxymethylenebutenolidase